MTGSAVRCFSMNGDGRFVCGVEKREEVQEEGAPDSPGFEADGFFWTSLK